MKYEYVTSDKLKKSLKKKSQSDFENQIRLMASGIYPMYEVSKRSDIATIVENAVQNALEASKTYEDDGNSAFIYFSTIIKNSLQKNSAPVNSEKNRKWSF